MEPNPVREQARKLFERGLSPKEICDELADQGAKQKQVSNWVHSFRHPGSRRTRKEAMITIPVIEAKPNNVGCFYGSPEAVGLALKTLIGG